VADGRPLKVADTICGLLLEPGRKESHILVNPACEYRERYQAYLFGSQIAQSELVVAIRNGEHVQALLNFEHTEPDVFDDYHIAVMEDIAAFLSLFVSALLAREETQRSVEIGSYYVMTRPLERMRRMYHHKINQLLPKSRICVGELSKELEGADDSIKQRLTELSGYIDAFHDRTMSFLKDLPDYSKHQAIDVGACIEAVLEEFSPNETRRKKKISIEYAQTQAKHMVYASRLLREHLFNLVSNSCDAIEERIAKNEITHGIVKISVWRKEVSDNLSTRTSETSAAKIFVKITDNGGGVPSDMWPQIKEFGVTTKGRNGTGFGLPSAIHYVRGIGGDFHCENQYPNGFEVCFHLQEYVAQYHDPLISHELKKGEKDG
jgi:signal transduction histidine kinase